MPENSFVDNIHCVQQALLCLFKARVVVRIAVMPEVQIGKKGELGDQLGT